MVTQTKVWIEKMSLRYEEEEERHYKERKREKQTKIGQKKAPLPFQASPAPCRDTSHIEKCMGHNSKLRSSSIVSNALTVEHQPWHHREGAGSQTDEGCPEGCLYQTQRTTRG